MAEISYPFTSDSLGGGQQMVSQSQWQRISRLGSKDRADLRLVSTQYTGSELHFTPRIIDTTSVSIGPGRSIVGGFYYQLTADQVVPIASNTGTQGRKDLIVLRLDMTAGAVNLAVKKGQPAATPRAPSVTRDYDGIWEMALHVVNVPAQSGALSITNAVAYDVPDRVGAPWDAATVGEFQQMGTFVYDMDSNRSDVQSEHFNGTDGFVLARDLGKARTYTPTLVHCADPATRQGRWRWIAPNTVWFSAYLASTSTSDYKVSGNNWYIGLTLPVPASGATGQIFSGHLDNNGTGSTTALPNFCDVIGKTPRGSATSTIQLFIPNPKSTGEGLDGLKLFPRKGSLTVTGVYEANRL